MTQLLMLPDGNLWLTETGVYDRDSRYAGEAWDPSSWQLPDGLRREAWRCYGISQGWADCEFSARDEAEAAFTATAVGYRGFTP